MASKIVFNPFTGRLDFTEDTEVAIGDSITGGTSGSILFNKSGTFGEDNTNLFWDDTNNRLGVGTTAPNNLLSLYGVSIPLSLQRTTGETVWGFDVTDNGSLKILTTGTARFYFSSNGRLGIGDDPGLSSFAVTNGGSGGAALIKQANSAGIALQVRAASSQTANLQEWQNSSGTVLLAVRASGRLSNPSGAEYLEFGSADITLSNEGTSRFINLIADNIKTAGATGTPLFDHRGATVFNETGLDADFRIEGDADANLFRIDASADAILLGEDASSKIAFFGATAVAQQTELTDELTTITHTAPGTPDYALQDLTDTGGFGFATKDEGNTALSVIANLQARVNELETKLVAYGLLPDAD